MTGIRRLAGLKADCRGATLVEFALLAPAFIVMLLGVLQVGLALQSYNAMRILSGDVARYAMVEDAKGTAKTTTELQNYAENIGDEPPYLLTNVDAAVVTAANQRVTGANELTLTITYQIPSIVASMGLEGPEITYARPIFLTE